MSRARLLLLAPAPRFVLLGARKGASHGLTRTLATSAEPAAQAAPRRRRGRFLLVGVGAGGAAFAWLKYRNKLDALEAEKLTRSVREQHIPSRAENIEVMKSGKEFDVLVIGGGATGAGVALEAQLRGLSVACIEQEDFASGTSSKSTKLLWAGSRYLVKGLVNLFSLEGLKAPITAWEEFRGVWHMVMGCFRERTYMLQMNPHLTSWIPIAVPLSSWILWPPPFDYPPAALGPVTGLFVFFFKFYDALSLWTAPSSYVMSSSRAVQEFPQMDGRSMKYVSVFYEGLHNDARTNLAIAFTAATHGAQIANYAKATKVLLNDAGVACGAEVLDVANPNGERFEVKAKKIIYCGGPFTDGLRALSEGESVKPVVNGSGGTHIVLPQYYCPPHLGMVDMMTSRGSFLFFIPWEGYTLVGTTDVKTKPDLHHEVPEDEIQYLINECEKYLSKDLQVRRRDVMSAWYGIRPLAMDPNAKDQSSVSRDHVISHHPSNGITFISGGKWTTWREMAEDCIDQVLERHSELRGQAGPSKSLRTPLIGTGQTEAFPLGYHENLAVSLCQQFDLSWDIAQHLARTYGTRAAEVLDYSEGVKGSRSGLYKHYPRLYEGAANTGGYPYLEAEVRYAVEKEYAMKPADILARRTRLAFLNSTAAKLTLPRVVEVMGEMLGWDKQRKLAEHREAEEVLARDFAGPAPNKVGAQLRTACTADVKDIFDQIDTRHRGVLSAEGIGKAAVELGFPLDSRQLGEAMREMDYDGTGEVSFPKFLAWWNGSTDGQALQTKINFGAGSSSRWNTVES